MSVPRSFGLLPHNISRGLQWTVLALLFASGVTSMAFFILSKPFGDSSPFGKCANPYSVPPEENWSINLRGEAAWPGVAAGFSACLLSLILTVDGFIGRTVDRPCGKKARKTYGLALLLFCVAICLTLVFAILMTSLDILQMTGRVDSMYYTEDVECGPNILWYVALGSALLGFLACVLTCCVIEFQFLRIEDEGYLLQDVETESSTESILSDLDLAEYKKAFESEDILTIDAFLELNEEDLVKLGVPMGPRKKILKWIRQMKE